MAPSSPAYATPRNHQRVEDVALAILAALAGGGGQRVQASLLFDHLQREFAVFDAWLLGRDGEQLSVISATAAERNPLRLAVGGPLGKMFASPGPVSFESSTELVRFGATRGYGIRDAHGLSGALLLRLSPGGIERVDRLEAVLRPHLRALLRPAAAIDRGPELAQADVLSLAEMFAQKHTVREVCEYLLREAMCRSGAEMATLWLHDQAQACMRVRAVRGLPNIRLERAINAGRYQAVRVGVGQGLAGKVLLEGTPSLLCFSDDDGRRSEPGVVYCTPLFHRGAIVAVLMLKCDQANSRLPQSTAAIELLVGVAGPALCRAVVQDRASVDVVTGLQCGDVTLAILEGELTRSAEVGSDLAAIVVFVEGYAMVELGETWTSVLRDTDFAGSLSEGCLLVVLPDTDVEGARVVARRLADAVERPEGATQQHSIVTAMVGDTAETLLLRARELTHLNQMVDGICIDW